MESDVLPPHQKERVNTCLRCNHSYIAILGGSTKIESYVSIYLRDKEIVSRTLTTNREGFYLMRQHISWESTLLVVKRPMWEARLSNVRPPSHLHALSVLSNYSL